MLRCCAKASQPSTSQAKANSNSWGKIAHYMVAKSYHGLGQKPCTAGWTSAQLCTASCTNCRLQGATPSTPPGTKHISCHSHHPAAGLLPGKRGVRVLCSRSRRAPSNYPARMPWLTSTHAHAQPHASFIPRTCHIMRASSRARLLTHIHTGTPQ